MEVGHLENQVNNKINGFMILFRLILEKLFVQKDQKINALLVINELKKREIDVDKIKEFMKSLPEGEWNIKIFIDNLEELNEIFGVSDEEIRKYSINNPTSQDIINVRKQILIESMLEYAQFSKEFYDSLKFNNSDHLSLAHIELLNEFMMVFKFIRDNSEELYKRYKDKKVSMVNFNKFNIIRLPIEYLLLRIVYISLNLNNANEDKLREFAELLGKERISLQYQKIILPKYN